MASGGQRGGAGRPVGAKTRKTREVAERATAEGITPLEVMLRAMREAVAAEDTERAVEYAHMAAPYCHPRLGMMQVNGELSARLIVRSINGVDVGEITGRNGRAELHAAGGGD